MSAHKAKAGIEAVAKGLQRVCNGAKHDAAFRAKDAERKPADRRRRTSPLLRQRILSAGPGVEDRGKSQIRQLWRPSVDETDNFRRLSAAPIIGGNGRQAYPTDCCTPSAASRITS